jgi:hypothetical protein
VVPRHCGVDAGGPGADLLGDRYALAPDDHYRYKQDRVLAEFWVSLPHNIGQHIAFKSFFQILIGYIVFVYAEVFQARRTT